MAILFPSNPALNQEYTYNGLTHYWDGSAWTIKPTEPVESAQWGLIEGNLADQTDLQEALDDKATIAYADQIQAALDALKARRDNPNQVTKAQVGLGNVDNTSDANKPLSSAMVAALALKANQSALTAETTARQDADSAIVIALEAHLDDQNNPHNVTKDQLGLGNVDNTSDASKPISTAVATALTQKTNRSEFAGVAFTGSYNSLIDLPVLFNGTWAALTGKPNFAPIATSGAWADITGKPTFFDGTWASLSGKPTFAPVATTGLYNDLTGKPALGTAAAQNVGFFATAAQGSLADNALREIQSGSLNVSVDNTDPLRPKISVSQNATVISWGEIAGSIGDQADLTNALNLKANSDAVVDALALKANTTDLATVATTGVYDDLSGKPVLFSGAYADLTGKPALFDGTWASLSGKPTFATVATTGAYDDLSGKPVLFSGNYNDLTNKPAIPAAQVNADWNATSGIAQILNKPVLFSGAYDDLSGKPVLFDGTWASLSGKPTFATVATSGDYNDLINKPVLFSGNYDDLTNKPVPFSGAYGDLTGLPTLGTASAQDVGYFALSATTATAGNGLTGGGALGGNFTFTLGTPSNITLSSTNSVTATSHTHNFAPGGTTSQYIRGDGSLATYSGGDAMLSGSAFTGAISAPSASFAALTITGRAAYPTATVAAASGTLTAAALNRIVLKTSTSVFTVTINSNLGANGDMITFANPSTATMTIQGGSGVTLYNAGVSGSIAVESKRTITLIRMSDTEWGIG